MIKNNKPKVILLVAGEGKRLRPFTLDRPKCMVEIDGVSLIDRQLSVIRAEGLDNIVMIGGYKANMLDIEGIDLKINPRYYETNMLWTLFSAEDELDGEVIVISVAGGIANTTGFSMVTGNNRVLGFSFSGTFIPAGNGILALLTIVGSGVACLSEDGLIISSDSGVQLPASIQNCNTIYIQLSE